MNQEERRKQILDCIQREKNPVSGTALAKGCGVSRQVIVQDIALLRAAGYDILSTNRGYICRGPLRQQQVFKVQHTDEQIEEELYTVVDCGGTVSDVFVDHEVYGKIRAELNISSRRQANAFLCEIQSGKSRPLKNITSGVHFHTVTADSPEILEQIYRELKQKGFLLND